MKKTLLILFLISITFYSYAETVAQVNIDKLSPLLKEYIFQKDEKLKKQYLEATDYTKNAFKHMKFGKDGKVSFNQADIMKLGSMNKFKITQKVDKLVLRNLTIILDKMNLDYDLIIKSNKEDSVLFSKKAIKDITQIVYQEIVKRLEANKK
jgi:hypothetical protein